MTLGSHHMKTFWYHSFYTYGNSSPAFAGILECIYDISKFFLLSSQQDFLVSIYFVLKVNHGVRSYRQQSKSTDITSKVLKSPNSVYFMCLQNRKKLTDYS